MAPPFPSIQSFFQPTWSSASRSDSLSPANPSFEPGKGLIGDGFSAADIESVVNPPTNTAWIPTRDYEEMDIADLVPGPQCVTFMGRIVNIFEMATPSKKPMAANGCLKLVLRDDTGTVTVRLWYAKTAYTLRLGQLLSVWTQHISNGDHSGLAPSSAPLFASVFPERERLCHIMMHQYSDDGQLCTTPKGYRGGQHLPKLMTLKSFMDGGHEVEEGRVLVCVKSIGARKTITTKQDTTTTFTPLHIFDNTLTATLTLFAYATYSAPSFIPSHTILLLTSPGHRPSPQNTLSLTLNASTTIDVNPSIPDAVWLRKYASRLTKREHINPPFPSTLIDVASARDAEVRVLYTLADIDNFARANPCESTTGYLSVLLSSVELVRLMRRNMLLSAVCCGVPVYSSTLTTPCRQCDKVVELRLNPRVLGEVMDETGVVEGGKLVFSAQAWEQLFGRSVGELAGCDVETLGYLEERMMWMRVTLGFRWIGEGEMESGDGEGRLCVWGVYA